MYVRINYFYQDYNLCQDDCYYNGIIFNESKVECICPENYTTMEIYNNEREIKSNQLLNNNNINKYNNIMILKCYNMFYKYPANFGFIIFILISASLIFSIIFFYMKEYSPMKYINNLKILYELKKSIKEEKIPIEPEKPKVEKKKKEKKTKFKLIIGLMKKDNEDDKNENKKQHTLKNKSRNSNNVNSEDDGNQTIIYEKDMFNGKQMKTESKEKLIDKPKFKIIKSEVSEYHLMVNKYKNMSGKIRIGKNCISFLKTFLNNYPITKICFIQKEYKLMSPKIYYEYFSLNLSFFLGLFSLLIAINCILFNDDLVTSIYEDPSHKLSFIKYLINSCLAAAVYIVIGIIFSLIFIYGIQGFYPGQIYEEKSYKSKINGKVRRYLIGIIIFQILQIIFVIFGWYYSSIFCNIYNKSQKYLIIQTLLSLIIEAIFYLILSVPIFFFKK